MDVARELVLQLYPEARAAWLGGSVVRGDASPTSDPDITVLHDGPSLQKEFLAEVAAGPEPLSADGLNLLRYTVTDLLEDLAGAVGDVRLAVASVLWQEAARGHLVRRRV